MIKTKNLTEQKVVTLSKSWGMKYPVSIKSWQSNWEYLSQFYKYPYDIRRIIYITNAVKGFPRQIRKVTKIKERFPSESALKKLFYLTIQNIIEKWASPCATGH